MSSTVKYCPDNVETNRVKSVLDFNGRAHNMVFQTLSSVKWYCNLPYKHLSQNSFRRFTTINMPSCNLLSYIYIVVFYVFILLLKKKGFIFYIYYIHDHERTIAFVQNQWSIVRVAAAENPSIVQKKAWLLMSVLVENHLKTN